MEEEQELVKAKTDLSAVEFKMRTEKDDRDTKLAAVKGGCQENFKDVQSAFDLFSVSTSFTQFSPILSKANKVMKEINTSIEQHKEYFKQQQRKINVIGRKLDDAKDRVLEHTAVINSLRADDSAAKAAIDALSEGSAHSRDEIAKRKREMQATMEQVKEQRRTEFMSHFEQLKVTFEEICGLLMRPPVKLQPINFNDPFRKGINFVYDKYHHRRSSRSITLAFVLATQQFRQFRLPFVVIDTIDLPQNIDATLEQYLKCGQIIVVSQQPQLLEMAKYVSNITKNDKELEAACASDPQPSTVPRNQTPAKIFPRSHRLTIR